MREHCLEYGAVAPPVPSVDDRTRHRAYAEAVHFMRRSGREAVPTEAIVALVAYLRKDFEVPSAKLIEDGYRELVAESGKESVPVSNYYREFDPIEEPIDFELIENLIKSRDPQYEPRAEARRKRTETRSLGEILGEAFNRKKSSEAPDHDAKFEPPAHRKADGERYRYPSLQEQDVGKQSGAPPKSADAKVIRIQERAAASERRGVPRCSDRSDEQGAEARGPAVEPGAQRWIDPSVQLAFEELGHEIRRNLQEKAHAAN